MSNEPNKDLFVMAKDREDTSEKINRPSLTFWQDSWMRLRKNKGALFGMIVLILIVLMAIFGPIFSSHGLDDQDLSLSRMPPKVQGLENFSWLGLDGKNRETFEADTIELAEQRALARFQQPDTEFIEAEVKQEPNNETGELAVVEYAFDKYAAQGVDEYFWFGTDTLGRDLFTRVWLGTRISLLIALVAAFIDMLVGVAYGGISAYFGGRTDTIMQRIIEVLIGIPT